MQREQKEERSRRGTYFLGGFSYAENQAVWGAPLVQKRSILGPRSLE